MALIFYVHDVHVFLKLTSTRTCNEGQLVKNKKIFIAHLSTKWPCYWTNVTHILTLPIYYGKHPNQVSSWLDDKCGFLSSKWIQVYTTQHITDARQELTTIVCHDYFVLRWSINWW